MAERRGLHAERLGAADVRRRHRVPGGVLGDELAAGLDAVAPVDELVAGVRGRTGRSSEPDCEQDDEWDEAPHAPD